MSHELTIQREKNPVFRIKHKPTAIDIDAVVFKIRFNGSFWQFEFL
jgi:hypothetical protein